MPLKYNENVVERASYNNKVVNIIKYNDVVILEDNKIIAGNYTGNTILTKPTNGTHVINLIANETTFTSIKIDDNYLSFGDTQVYSFSNNSWANVYKAITITADIFVDQNFYDWFNGAFIKTI